MTLHPVIKEVLFTEEQLDAKARELAAQITAYYEKKGLSEPLVLLGLLKGCVPFFANLMKYITIPVTTEFMVVTSYGYNAESNQAPQILLDVNQNIQGKEVVVVEDIIDSGYTLEFIKKHLALRGANEVRIVTMLNKFERREVEVHVDWIGYDIPDYFVVGYGLDYAQRFRNLPYVAAFDLKKFDAYDWEKDFEKYQK